MHITVDVKTLAAAVAAIKPMWSAADNMLTGSFGHQALSTLKLADNGTFLAVNICTYPDSMLGLLMTSIQVPATSSSDTDRPVVYIPAKLLAGYLAKRTGTVTILGHRMEGYAISLRLEFSDGYPDHNILTVPEQHDHARTYAQNADTPLTTITDRTTYHQNQVAHAVDRALAAVSDGGSRPRLLGMHIETAYSEPGMSHVTHAVAIGAYRSAVVSLSRQGPNPEKTAKGWLSIPALQVMKLLLKSFPTNDKNDRINHIEMVLHENEAVAVHTQRASVGRLGGVQWSLYCSPPTYTLFPQWQRIVPAHFREVDEGGIRIPLPSGFGTLIMHRETLLSRLTTLHTELAAQGQRNKTVQLNISVNADANGIQLAAVALQEKSKNGVALVSGDWTRTFNINEQENCNTPLIKNRVPEVVAFNLRLFTDVVKSCAEPFIHLLVMADDKLAFIEDARTASVYVLMPMVA